MKSGAAENANAALKASNSNYVLGHAPSRGDSRRPSTSPSGACQNSKTSAPTSASPSSPASGEIAPRPSRRFDSGRRSRSADGQGRRPLALPPKHMQLKWRVPHCGQRRMRGPVMKLRIALVTAILLETCGTLHAQNWFPNSEHHDVSWEYRDNHRDNHDYGGEISDTARQACEPEVFRLCVRYIPDRDAITACLHNNLTRLNTDCRAVMQGRLK
jgi:hypothetical protein